MNNPELMIVLLTGVVVMTGFMSVQMKWYGIPRWKSIIVSMALVLTGLEGSRIWYYIENGAFTGRSFYGAIFLSPIVFYVVAKLIREPYSSTMDLVAPSGCLTLAMVKIQCLRDGCCDGMALYVNENRDYVKFPSQIVEMVAFLVIAAILFVWSKKTENRGKIFPWFMVLYGSSRFVLNCFRGDTEVYALGLSAGAFWSILALLIGGVVLIKKERIKAQMNHFIKMLYEQGLSSTIYNAFFALGFVSVFLFVVLFGRKMGIPLWKSTLVVLIVYPTILLWMFVMFWIESGFRDFGGNNIVRVFVYVPLVAYPVAKLLKIEFKKICSMLAFGPVAQHAVSHFGCIFAGCCMGYPCSWGIYNPSTEDIRFPSQPIEAIIAWIIIIFLMIRAKKRGYTPDGLEYPQMLMLFGASRFLCEFLRDNNKIWLGCSSLAFHALFMCVVGVAWIVIMSRKRAEQ